MNTLSRKPLFDGLDDVTAIPNTPKPVDLAQIDKVSADQEFPSRQPSKAESPTVTQDTLSQDTPDQDSLAQPTAPQVTLEQPTVTQASRAQPKPSKQGRAPAPEPVVEDEPLPQMYGSRGRLSAYMDPEIVREVRALVREEERSESWIVGKLIQAGLEVYKQRKGKK